MSLARRASAELAGTGLLVAAVIGSGIAATRLSPHDTGLQLLENAIATALALGTLIIIFGPVSGAHFNPVVSAADWWLGRRTGAGLTARELAVYTIAQTVGAIGGAVLANLMFGLAAVSRATTTRDGAHLWLAETIATLGLVLLIAAMTRTGRAGAAPAAVGAYIGAAYWWTSSTSFANPAVTIGRMFSDTFAGIAPTSVPGFIAAQLLGGILALAAIAWWFPRPTLEMQPTLEKTMPSVLFVCVHNAGRSQMAAGWLRHLAGDTVEIRSAGSAPAERINPLAVQAMAEVGIDITAERPKKLDHTAAEASDVIITMGCGDTCPFFPGKRYEDWVLDDPAGQDIDAVRTIRDAIRIRVEQLLTELTPR